IVFRGFRSRIVIPEAPQALSGTAAAPRQTSRKSPFDYPGERRHRARRPGSPLRGVRDDKAQTVPASDHSYGRLAMPSLIGVAPSAAPPRLTPHSRMIGAAT